MFDIGANRGDAVLSGLNKGYEVVALEPAPKVFLELVKNFLYNPNVVPLKFAVSDQDYQFLEFYEAIEDGLSSLNRDWLTSEKFPYNGKSFRTIKCNSITVDTLISTYGTPDLVKIDVEGAEWGVFRGMSRYCGTLAFEWTDVTLDEHIAQLKYLETLGYNYVGPQFIEHHLQEPQDWYNLDKFLLKKWVENSAESWMNGGWKSSHLRQTPDVGMLWVK